VRRIGSARRRLALCVVVSLAAALALAAASVSAPEAVERKQAEAEAVLAQIQQIDAELEHVVDDYNAATERLAALEAELQRARDHLTLARDSSKVAQRTLAERVVALYVNGGEANALEIILGAESLDDLLDRVDAANRVSEQDAHILEAVKAARASIAKEERRLEKALAEQERVVAERAATRDEIEAQLAERQRLYSSIEDEIQDLLREERERAARLAREAERQLEAQQAPADGGGEESSGGATAAPPVAASEPSAAPPPGRYGGVVGVAMSPAGFDCSGLVAYAYAQVGVSLPHNAAAQYGHGVAVPRDQLQAGDIVFFNGLGHNGIYVGGGLFVHSPHTGDVVKVSSLSDSWYAATYVGARRIL
jgi:cell wall-associated NlpC family hydrolase